MPAACADKLVEYSRSAHERGLEVIVAGAGGAAHLPGMVAAMTPLPVVGVPVKTSGEPPLHTPAMGMRPCLRPLLSWGTTVHFSGGSITFSCDPNAADLGCAALSGVDSLYSIVQMPRGVPVATVAIGNATNAGLLAARIVGSTRPAIRDAMLKYQAEARAEVEGKGTKLVGQGYEAYLAAMQNKSTTVM